MNPGPGNPVVGGIFVLGLLALLPLLIHPTFKRDAKQAGGYVAVMAVIVTGLSLSTGSSVGAWLTLAYFACIGVWTTRAVKARIRYRRARPRRVLDRFEKETGGPRA